MVFVLGRRAPVEIQVVPHAVGFDVVADVGGDDVPVLDDGLRWGLVGVEIRGKVRNLRRW